MRTGAWAPACLLLTALAGASPGAIPDDVYPMKDTRFEIPIKVDPARRADIRVIQLFISTDQGKTWQQKGSVSPETPSFPFLAQADGTYWFSIVVIDKNNNREPPDIYKAPVGMKVLIDTLKPEVRLKAERQNDAVSASWEVREEYPDLGKFRVEWKPTEGTGPWTPVPVPSSLNGQTTIRAAEAITVRAVCTDAAGNVGEAEAKAPAAAGVMTVSAATGPTVTPSMPAETAVGTPAVKPVDPPAIGGFTAVVSGAGAGGKTAMPALPGGAEESAPPSGLPTAVPSPLPSAPAPAPEHKTEPRAVSLTGSNVVAASPPSPSSPPPPPVKEPTPLPSPTPALPTPTLTPAPTTPTPSPLPSAAMPTPSPVPSMSEPSGGSGHEVPVVNNRRVSMEYEVKVGPSGVGGVELYVTRDDGLSWKLTPGEHAAVGELTAGVVKRIVSVDLPEDGSYGFYLVVRSGAGMSQPAPRGGVDAPQMRIKLDTKPPTALLYKPEQDPGQKDALMLKWKASDENLTATPITIQWAERPSGPWNSIGPEQMPNTGSYSWTVPEKGIPFQVYLRLTVRDTAGNMNVAETDQPQLIDLVRPVLNQVRFVPH